MFFGVICEAVNNLGIVLSFIKMNFVSMMMVLFFHSFNRTTKTLSTPLSDTGRLWYLCIVFMYGYSVQLK